MNVSHTTATTDITELHIKLYTSLKTFLNTVENRVSTNTVLKTFQLSLTFLVNNPDEGGWYKRQVEFPVIHKVCLGFKIPSSDKKLVKFLRDFTAFEIAKNPSISDGEKTFPHITLEQYDAAGGSNARTLILKKFRSLNDEFLNKNDIPRFLSDIRDATFSVFHDTSLERLALQIKCSLTLLDKADPGKKEVVSLTGDLQHACSTCKGWRSTAHDLNQCAGCIQGMPEKIPTRFDRLDANSVVKLSETNYAFESMISALAKEN